MQGGDVPAQDCTQDADAIWADNVSWEDLLYCKYGFPFKIPQLTEELDED